MGLEPWSRFVSAQQGQNSQERQGGLTRITKHAAIALGFEREWKGRGLKNHLTKGCGIYMQVTHLSWVLD